MCLVVWKAKYYVCTKGQEAISLGATSRKFQERQGAYLYHIAEREVKIPGPTEPGRGAQQQSQSSAVPELTAVLGGAEN